MGEGSPVCVLMALWLRHIDRFEQQYEKAFARYPLFGADLMDRIYKRVQVFLHSCNTTAIEEVELGALEEFRGLQKRVERGEWMTSIPVWVEQPALREEGRRKSEGNRTGARNHGVDPQLRISENLVILTQVECSENLRLRMGADGTEICLRYISKGECDRSNTRSHVPLNGHKRELVIRFIWGSQEAMNKKRKFDGIGAQASHGGTWDRGGYRNL